MTVNDSEMYMRCKNEGWLEQNVGKIYLLFKTTGVERLRAQGEKRRRPSTTKGIKEESAYI